MKHILPLLLILLFTPLCYGLGGGLEIYLPEENQETACPPSARNSRQESIRAYHSRWDGYVLMLDSPDGTLRLLYESPKLLDFYPISPELIAEIFWITDDVFACVCSGRRRSYYAVYELAREDSTDTTMGTYELAQGVVGFQANWRITRENGSAALQALHNEKVILTIAETIADKSQNREFLLQNSI